MRPVKVLRGRRVLLHALDELHAEGPYLAWLKDSTVTRFLEARFTEYTLERLRCYIRSENERTDVVFFGIFSRSDGRLIGTLRLSTIRKRHRNCEIGLMIGDRTMWGRGCATEAIELACQYAFETLDLHRVVAGCYSTNLASIRAFGKAGFEQEGCMREDRLDGVDWVDTVILGVLNPTPAKARSTSARKMS